MENKNNKPWLINCRVKRGYWVNEDNRKRALKWLIEDKLDIFNNDYKLTSQDFTDNGLGVLYNNYFYKSIKLVFKFLYPENYMDICEDNKNRFKKYPDDYKPWIDGKVPYGYWTNENNRKKALKWLIEDKLDIFNSNHKLVLRDFEDNGLDRLFVQYFGSIERVFKFLYPENYMDIYEDNKNK